MKQIIVLSILITLAACGKTGPKGDPGESVVGPQGAPGSDAAQITPVELCPGFVPKYPYSFPEYGLCIDNQLYGVYSANGGFLALLPPGTYSSNGINASCNLTVASNCRVSRN